MKKKKVTAPLTYDPGKGRPKEHLAYLNWQEMQALKRLNGNNQERGPKGLPSFPPADAIGSSSRASSSKPSSGKMGASSSQTGGTKKSSTSSKIGSAASVTKSTGYSGGSNIGAQKSSSTKIGSAVTGAAKGMGAAKASAGVGAGKASASVSGGRTGFSGAGQNAVDAKVKAEAAKRDAVKISRESPAYKADTAKKGIGSLGFSQQFEKQPGGKVKGAISAQKEQMYQTAPRYNQPQTQRIQNPTAIPSMERTSYERMQMAEAARQRAAKAAQQVARTGPFGPQSYTGTYNPKTGRYDARPVAAPASIPMDSSVAGRLAQANKNYKTVTGPGGMVGRTYADPDVTGKTLGDVVKDYGKYAYDTVGGYLTAAGDYLGLPDRPVMPSGDVAMRMANEALMAEQPTPTKPIQDRLPSDFSPRPIDNRAYAGLLSGVEPYTTGDFAVRNAVSPSFMNQYSKNFVEKSIEQGLESAMDAAKAGRSAPPAKVSTTPAKVDQKFSWEGVRPYDIRVTEPPASGIDLREPARTRGITNVSPAGYEMPGEKFVSVEDVPEAGVVGLTREVQDFPRNVSPEVQEEMRKQDKKNKIGIGVMKRAPVFGRVLSAGDALLSGVTGRGIAQRTADLKRAYMQSSPSQQAALEAKYPNLTKFANDAGIGSQLPMSNYSSWQERSGLGNQGGREGGGDRSGIASLTVPTQTVAPTATESTTGTTPSGSAGNRPEIYYYWDLGVNIPSPTDPNYTQYQTYLRERAAAQAAMYG